MKKIKYAIVLPLTFLVYYLISILLSPSGILLFCFMFSIFVYLSIAARENLFFHSLESPFCCLSFCVEERNSFFPRGTFFHIEEIWFPNMEEIWQTILAENDRGSSSNSRACCCPKEHATHENNNHHQKQQQQRRHGKQRAQATGPRRTSLLLQAIMPGRRHHHRNDDTEIRETLAPPRTTTTKRWSLRKTPSPHHQS